MAYTISILTKIKKKRKGVHSKCKTSNIKTSKHYIKKYKDGYEIINIKRSLQHFLNAYDMTYNTYITLKKDDPQSENYRNIEAVYESLKPNSFVSGTPAKPHQNRLRQEVVINKLPDLLNRIRKLEKNLVSDKEL